MKGIAEKHVFIVDDEPGILQAVCETLGSLGVRISCFSSAIICLEQLQSQKCDLLITDLKMPEMDGIELLKRAKQLVPCLPVLVMTGYGSAAVAVEIMNSGAVDLVEKPLVKQHFLRKIKAMLQQNASANTHMSKSLTQGETELLKLILDGKTDKEMATVLNCSQRSIEVHRAHLMKKYGVSNIVGLVKRTTAIGLVDLPAKQTRSNVDSCRDLNISHDRKGT
jgi:two-component system response regulator FixJ